MTLSHLWSIIWRIIGTLSVICFVVGIIRKISYARFPAFELLVKNKIKPHFIRFFRDGKIHRREQILDVAIIRVRSNPPMLAFVLKELRWEFFRNEKTQKELYRDRLKAHWAFYPFDYYGFSSKEKAEYIRNPPHDRMVPLDEYWLEVIIKQRKQENSTVSQSVKIKDELFSVDILQTDDYLVTDTHYEWEDIKKKDKKLYYKLILWVFGENRKLKNGLKEIWKEWGKRV